MPGNDIDIKLKLDGERDFKSAVKDVNTELKNMQSALKLADAQAKGQANSLQSLEKREQALNKVLDTATKKRNTLTQIVEKARAKQEEAAKALEKAKKAENANAEEIAKAEKAYLSATQRVNEWETQLNKAEKEVAETNTEVQKNSKYLEEAKNSADGCASSIDEYGKEVKEADKETQGLNEQVGALTKMEAVSKLAEKASEAFGKLNSAASSAAKELDVGYDTIVKKTGATGEAFKDMQDIADDLFGSMPVQMDEVGAAIGEVNTRFALTDDALADTSKSFLRFAKVNETDVSNAVDEVQNAMASFNIDARDAGKVLDTLTRTGQKTGANVSNLSKKITENATAFQEMGLDIYQSINFMGGLETAGADATSVLSGLKRALKSATEQGKPFNTALVELEEAIKNGTDSTDGLTIAYDLFGKSGAGVFQAVKNGQISFTDLADSTDVLTDATGSLEAAYNGTLSAWDEWTIAQNNLKVVGAELSQSYQEALTPAVQTLTEVVKDAKDRFDELPESAQTAIAVIAGIGGKALEVGPQIANVATQLATLKIAKSITGEATTATSKFSSTLKGAGIAVGVIGTAVGIAAALYSNYRKRVEEAAIEQRNFANTLEGLDNAYKSTHQQVEILTSGANEYISTSERIAQLEALRVQVANENATAQLNLEDAQEQLDRNTQQLTDTTDENTEAQKYNATAVGATREDIAKLEEKQGHLQSAVESANSTYEASNADLELINSTLEALKGQEDSTASAIEDANNRINASRDASITKAGEESAAYSNLSTWSKTVAEDVSTAILGMHETITGSISGITTWFDEVQERSNVSAETMAQNLQAQINDIKAWEENLAFLADQGINQELLKYLADLGPSGAAYVQAFVDSANGETEIGLDEMNRLWEEKLELEKGINDEAEKVYEAIGEIAAGSEPAWTTLKEQLNAQAQESGKGVALGMAEGIKAAMDDAASAGEDLGSDTIDGVNKGAETHSPSRATTRTGKDVGAGLANGVTSSIPQSATAGAELGRQTIASIHAIATAGGARTAGQALAVQVASGITASQGSVQASALLFGTMVAQSLITGITNQSGAAYSAGSNTASNAVNGMQTAVSGAWSAGYNMAQGMANGIYAGESMVINASAQMAANALQAAKNRLQINSPSKAFEEEVGEQSALGAVKGFNKTLDLQADRMLTAFSGGLPDFSVYNTGAKVEVVNKVYLGDRELSSILSAQVVREISTRSKAYNANAGR